MRAFRQLVFYVLVLGPLVVLGCHSILGLDDPVVERADGGGGDAADELQVIGPGDDGAADAADDAVVDAGEPDVTYNVDWDDTTLWNSVDLADLNVGVSSFVGAVFDGRYVYFAPSNNTVANAFAARYDTKGNALTAVASWEFFDTASLSPNARGFEGAFFDGRYVYFVPYATLSEHVGLFVRFDTQAGRAFNDSVAWSTFDTTTLNQYAKGYIGASFDGRYAYVAPGIGNFASGDRPEANVARFDTTGSFTASASWQFFDTQTAHDAGPRGFVGTVLSDQHLYFVPYGYAGAQRGRVVRFDRSKPFGSASSWEMFDADDLDAGAVGFQGGAYDGRYVYFAPLLQPSGTYHGNVMRFDTTRPFTEPASWGTLNLATLDGGVAPSQAADASVVVTREGYVGAGFDGRFLYMVPSIDNESGFHGWLARFDTKKPSLDDPSAWSFYDMSRINPNAKGFAGAVFDGQYMYFVPTWKTVVVRFYAKFPRYMPPFMRGGSFL